MLKYTIALCAAICPFAIGLAEDTKTLENNTYQDIGLANCSDGLGGCYVTFNATTATVTEITNVSCNISLLEGIQVNFATLFDASAGANGSAYLQPFVYGTADPYASIGVIGSTKVFFSKGGIPTFEFAVYNPTGTIHINCSISGFHS
jgi:hypothetical protein